MGTLTDTYKKMYDDRYFRTHPLSKYLHDAQLPVIRLEQIIKPEQTNFSK